MFAIGLKGMDGSDLPYRLVIEPNLASGKVGAKVIDAENAQVLDHGIFRYEQIPVTSMHVDASFGTLAFGFEPKANRLLVQFGPEESRLAMVSAAEVRSAVNVCRLYANSSSENASINF